MSKVKILRDVLNLEAKSIELAGKRLNEEMISRMVTIFEELIQSGGDIVFCGVGKSGLIGAKLASTFTSLGLRSFLLHPTDALHGDLGRVRKNDVIVFLSKSGSTEEILKMLPFLNSKKENIVGLLGALDSPIGNQCAVVFDCSVEKEACINNQAPTTSSTVALAMGDALAVLFEHMVDLSKEGFAQNHPGGFLGKSLRMKVQDLMCESIECAVVDSKATLKDVILAMTNKPLGACAVIDSNRFVGLIVEGDIRRCLSTGSGELSVSVKDFLNKSPTFVTKETLAFDALKLMEQRNSPIAVVPVLEKDKFYGFIRLHDLLKAGLSSNS